LTDRKQPPISRLLASFNPSAPLLLFAALSVTGFDHSGHFGSAKFSQKQSRMDRTVDYVEKLAKEFSKSKYGSIVTAIEVLNEPFFNDNLEDFYADAYRAIRRHSKEIVVVLSDAFSEFSSPFHLSRYLSPLYQGLDYLLYKHRW